jgi:excisionase family DNA binding protein
MRQYIKQRDLMALLQSEMKGELDSKFYSTFIQRIISQSLKENDNITNSMLLSQIKASVDSMREKLLNELILQIENLRDEPIESYPKLHPKVDDLLDIKEICSRFGISRPTIYSWEERGLKRTKIGGRVYFKLSDINEFIGKQS